MNLHRVLCLTMLLVSAPLLAAEEEKEKSPWSGSAKLGYLATTGNTENSSLNAGFNVAYTRGLWTHEALAASIYSEESGATTAEAYDLGWKSARNITDNDFIFGRLDWRKTRFGAFDTQFSQTLGYGRRLINIDKHSLNGELGVGARQSETQDGISIDETIFRGALRYRWALSETSEFRQDLVVEAGEENVFSESVTAISARVVGGIALVASYTIRNNSDVPPLTKKTDTFTALSLEYAF